MSQEPDISLDNSARDTGRLEAFSDGVIAVAITLLILDIHVPPSFDPKSTLLQLLLRDGISYLGYVISFTIIGLFWINHHYMFKYIRQTDHSLLLLNMLALMSLVFIPFTTSLLAKHFNDGYATSAAVIYSASLFLSAMLYNIIWWYASAHPHLLASGLTSKAAQQMERRYLVSIPLYIVTLLVSAFNVRVTLVFYIAIALLYALPANRLPFGKQRASQAPKTIREQQIPQKARGERIFAMRMMVTIHFNPQHFEAMAPLLPKEQEHIRELMSKGIVETIYISTDRTAVWLIMKGESREQLEQEVSTFPLYPYMEVQFVPLLEN